MADNSPDGEEGVGFDALGLDTRLLEALSELGYEEPTPIQRETIPPLLAGRDLVGQAATGTGKTAAFALPLIQRLAAREPGHGLPSGLVLVPTRELAMQVAEAIHRYGRSLNISVLPIYGGQSFGQQLRVMKRGVDVVVATPGRALDHIRRGTLQLASVEVVVLDEADEMLDMGFAEDLEAILGETGERQTVLFSATMPARIGAIARKYLRDPARIEIARERLAEGAVPQVRQTAYIVPRAHKLTALARVLDMEAPEAAIVFCRTRNEVDELTEKLSAHGYRSEAIHGGMTQEQRDRVMKKVRSGTTDLLIATDVAARGLDIPRLSHVINYDLPNAPEPYVHRIGRVGRAGREGVAITLAEPREHRLLRAIEQLTKRKIEVARVPTVADLRSHRLDVVRASLRETLLAGDLEPYRVVVEALSDEFDPMEVAMAAVKQAAEASAADENVAQEEIPEVRVPSGGAGGSGGYGGSGGGSARGRKGPRAGGSSGASSGGGSSRSGPGVARLWIGAGRAAGIRPQDLVGAIAGEAGIRGKEVGAIEIADRFSIVEVPEEMAQNIIAALRGSSIKGRKVTVRMDKGRS